MRGEERSGKGIWTRKLFSVCFREMESGRRVWGGSTGLFKEEPVSGWLGRPPRASPCRGVGRSARREGGGGRAAGLQARRGSGAPRSTLGQLGTRRPRAWLSVSARAVTLWLRISPRRAARTRK